MSALLAALIKPLEAMLRLLVIWISGKAAGRREGTIKELREYADTSKRIDHVEPVSSSDDALKWLRDRAKQ
jgi:hypothetical protein